MGCAVSCLDSTMALFRGNSNTEYDERTKLERKLYIAKESPDPEFDLSECNLQEVPSGIYSICKVFRKELLFLNNNKLISLDHGGNLSDLYILKGLNLSCNNLRQLPDDIRYLMNVTELYLQNNYIKVLPDTINYLQNLLKLDVSNNRLRTLTPSLGKLRNLRILKITNNKDLKQLCPELCNACNLTTIELDVNQFELPPPDVIMEGTEKIMRYLCAKMGIEYVKPSCEQVDGPSIHSPNPILDPFEKNTKALWEHEAYLMTQESEFHKAAKSNREKILSKVLQDQLNLDVEIAKVQETRDIERLRLIKELQKDEREIEYLVDNFIKSVNLKPEVIQQQLQHEQSEHDRLLEIIRQSNDNVRKADVLSAMEALIEENLSLHSSKRSYQVNFDDMKQNMLAQELKSTEKLEQLYKSKDQSRTVLIDELLDDQDVQKAVVASLVEKVDARSWSLNQEIALISSNLAKLSAIEQEKKRLHLCYNFSELLHQRTQLLSLLDELQMQKHKRRTQLIATMQELERQSDTSTDYWLKNYQKVVESAPKSLLGIGKKLDPLLANHLLQEGVIHCLPFLFNFLFSDDSLSNINREMLKDSGVSLLADREGILRAIHFYVSAKNENHNQSITVNPGAPEEIDVTQKNFTGVLDAGNDDTINLESECVICMDARCEVVFVPCGHLCCCLLCSDNDMECCPMCRGDIERKIKVIIA